MRVKLPVRTVTLDYDAHNAAVVTSSPGSLLPPEMNAQKAGGSLVSEITCTAQRVRHSVDTALMDVGMSNEKLWSCPRECLGYSAALP